MALDPSKVLKIGLAAAPAVPNLETGIKELVSTLMRVPFDSASAGDQLSTLCVTPGFDINALTHGDAPVMNLLLKKGNFAAATLLVNWGADAANALWLAAGIDGLTVDSKAHRNAIVQFVEALKIQESDTIRDNPRVVERRIRAVLTKAHELAINAQNTSIAADLGRLIEKPAFKDSAELQSDTPPVASMKKRMNPISDKKKKKLLPEEAKLAWDAKAKAGKQGVKKKKAKQAPPAGKKGKTNGRGGLRRDASDSITDHSMRAICRQKMLPWEVPGQRMTSYNPQPRVRLLV